MPTVTCSCGLCAGGWQLIRAAMFLQPQTTDSEVEDVTYGNARSTISLDDRIDPTNRGL